MSAVWLKIAAALCVLSVAEGDNVVWKNVGEDVNIACRFSQKEPYLYLKKGLHEDITLFYADTNSTKIHIKPENKIQQKGRFPNITFTIKNLTAADTGPYWCVFVSFDAKYKQITDKRNGSILLVIKEEPVPNCSSKESMFLVAIVVSVVALITLISSIILLRYSKYECFKSKAARLPINDVYEDMRGTIRR